ncbi:sensor histidine kinase [Cobetia amphilecti]|uniref:histidine kinase n=1 Tax=Cobetia amphilecti TaxID=1055104 RepID=A0AAP4X0Y4_9GAMM|nr:histidine kinase [Cobetia amphilecti]MDO6671513.1 histidine kinase [Cobetia amphilecti]
MEVILGAGKEGKVPAARTAAALVDARGADEPLHSSPGDTRRETPKLDAITLRIATCADLTETLPSLLGELLRELWGELQGERMGLLNQQVAGTQACSRPVESCVLHRGVDQQRHEVIAPTGLALPAKTRQTLQEIVSQIAHDAHVIRQPLAVSGKPHGILIALTHTTDSQATGDDWLWLGEPAAAALESGHASAVIDALSRGLALHKQQQARHAEDRKAAVAQALKDERRHLAAELHDTLAQELSYLQMQSARLTRAARHAPQEVQALAEDVHTQSRRALRQTRELINGAHATWEDAPLACVLDNLIEEFETRSGLVFELDNRIQALHLPDAQALQVMFIVREAMTNSVRHARATHLRLQLLYQSSGPHQFSGPQPAERVLLTIEDNGCGFDPADIAPAHFGLGIMQDRARQLGADFAITQPRHGGTRVTLSWERHDT